MNSKKKIVLIAALLAALSINLNASADDSASVTYTGQASAELVLDGQEGHDLYETQTVPYTCYRQVFDGYDRVCRQESYEDCSGSRNECRTERSQVCRTGADGRRICTPIEREVCSSRPVCRTRYHTVCRDEARYRSVADTCYRQERVRVGFEVDYKIQSNVQMTFEEAPAGTTPNETFTVSISNGSMALNLNDSGKLLAMVRKQIDVKTIAEDMGPQNPGLKLITATYQLQFMDVAAILAPVKSEIEDIRLSTRELRFVTGQVSATDFLVPHLYISRQEFLGSVRKKFDGNLPLGSYRFETRGDKTEVVVDLAKIGADVYADGKYNIGIELKVEDRESGNRQLLNASVLGSVLSKKADKRGVRPTQN